jgi:hypothetical protein
MSINILPDDVLLEIFGLHVVRYHSFQETKKGIEAWQSLVHVCQRWRIVVFGSSRYLKLQLVCATESQTPLRDTLDVWPALPLSIQGCANRPEALDNIIAALERSNRVCHIDLRDVSSSLLEDVLMAMQKPFPKLTSLSLRSPKVTAIIPDLFLVGFAPRLRLLWLEGIPFPTIPKLLLSAGRLDNLQLTDIPHSEYFSLNAIVTVLSTLTSLRSLVLQFQSVRSRPSRRLPPLTRSVLPTLKSLEFKGISEYLEHLVAHIDTPRLSTLYITFFNQLVFNTPQIIQFIGRIPGLKALEEARLAFYSYATEVRLSSRTPGFDQILVRIPCRAFDWQISSLGQVCTSFLHYLFVLEDLYIVEERPNWEDDIENTLLQELLHPFSAVKNIYLSRNFAPRIAPALQELVEGRTTEVLPTLENIFLEGLRPSGPDHEGIVKFVAARRLSDHPIAVSVWERVGIMSLDDDVLLQLFDLYVLRYHSFQETKKGTQAWQSLVHVCRRWRSVVLGSPRYLKLQLVCATESQTPLKDTLDVWPALPLIIQGRANRPEGLDNILAALERSDRVCHIDLTDVSSSLLEAVSTAMQMPLPELTSLSLRSPKVMTIIPDSFLGGFAPRLRSLRLDGIPYPRLPKLLLSATHLVDLDLYDIPHSGYFPPEAIVIALSMLTSLKALALEFQPPLSFPEQESRHPPPPPPLTRSVLPTLTSLRFKSASEYLEDFVSRIDTPRLDSLYITSFNQTLVDTPQTVQFIIRTPALKALEGALLTFEHDAANVCFSSQTPRSGVEIIAKISCREFESQVSSLEQVCTSSLPLLSSLEDLRFYENPRSPPDWKDDIENTLWQELLHPFSAVKNLYLSQEFAPRIAPALQELVGSRTTEVLPTLENVFLEGLQPSGPDQEGIVKFVAARQLSGHPITVSLWESHLKSDSELTESEVDD